MSHATRRTGTAMVLALSALATTGAGEQQPARDGRSIAAGRWVMPRTADGRPDLEGVWENNSATPLERPRQLADKPRLSDEELASLEQRAKTLFGPDAEATFGDSLYLTLLANTKPAGLGSTGSYSQNWLPDRYFEHRTSLIVDPPDGRLPPMTPAGTKRRAALAGTFGRVGASAQSMSLQDRCIHYGFPDLFAAYMAVYRIVQSPGAVAIQMEKIHDARVIPLDGRPHISSSMNQYLGDSRGRWDGDTLVVETIGFRDGLWADFYGSPLTDRARMTERIRRPRFGALEIAVTIDDPKAYTKPWTVAVNQRLALDTELMEYACLENEKDVPRLVGK